ncbi:hypothetical protein, partial [Borreliella garinii]|uniref:hypothetical protein n=1 Tax=Borreliella garinii TaxID=29519 RepID=UPI001AF01B8E
PKHNQFNRVMPVLSNESLESTHQNSSLPSNIIMVIFFLKKIIYVLILSLSFLYIRLKNRYKNNHAIFASTKYLSKNNILLSLYKIKRYNIFDM